MAPSTWLLALHQEAPDLRIPVPDLAAHTVLHMQDSVTKHLPKLNPVSFTTWVMVPSKLLFTRSS